MKVYDSNPIESWTFIRTAQVEDAAVRLLACSQLRTVNFAGCRRLTDAALGHLAAFEATSSLPSTDMVRGLQRLGFDDTVSRYYDEHIEADAVHEHLARTICDLATGGDPDLEAEVGFGAFVCLFTEERSAQRLVPAAGPA